MPNPTPAQDKLNATGIDQVCEWLEQGKGQRWIARQIGCGIWPLNEWLHATAERSARVNSATLSGAEAYEEQAIAILQGARAELSAEPQISSAIVALARERAQAAWRQASVRNPNRYSDKRTVEHTGVILHRPAQQLSTAELESIAAQGQTLQLGEDGTVK